MKSNVPREKHYTYKIVRTHGEAGYEVTTELIQGVGEHPTVNHSKYGIEIFWHIGQETRHLLIPWTSILEVRRFHPEDDWS